MRITKAQQTREAIQLLCAGKPPHTVTPSEVVKYLKERGCNECTQNVSKQMKKMGYQYRKPTIGRIIQKAEAKQQLVQGNLENFHKQVTGGLEEHNKQVTEKPKAEKPKVQKQEKTVKKNLEAHKSHTYICIASIEKGGFEYV